MKNLLVVLALLSFNVDAEDNRHTDRHYNTCRSSEAAIKSANRQEDFHRNQLLFTLEKGSTYNKEIIEKRLDELKVTREMIQKIHDDLKCDRYFNLE